jgi:inner membrane protein involved in colicin E2 resistance
MTKRIFAIVLIYFLTVAAWATLGGTVAKRTVTSRRQLANSVEGLWGSAQTQLAPTLYLTWPVTRLEKSEETDATTKQTKWVTRQVHTWEKKPLVVSRSDIDVDLQLEYRKKGLMWFSFYTVAFRAEYEYIHESEQEGDLVIAYRFPATNAIYDDFQFEVNGRRIDPQPSTRSNERDDGIDGNVKDRFRIAKGDAVRLLVAYRSRGLTNWCYSLGDEINQAKNFDLHLTTDFGDIDFPAGTLSPTAKTPGGKGWALDWQFNNLVSSVKVGMTMPEKLNPGPFTEQLSFFAPVCLLFFFAWMFVITLLRKVDLHPMNYLFLSAAFFSFHLLFAYTVDHLDLVPAFLIASVVSVGLVVSYLRLVVGLRFAAVEAGVSQLVYLVLFSSAHFVKDYTGLIVTIGSIATLFIIMQLTGRINWNEKFRREPRPIPVAQPVK